MNTHGTPIYYPINLLYTRPSRLMRILATIGSWVAAILEGPACCCDKGRLARFNEEASR